MRWARARFSLVAVASCGYELLRGHGSARAEIGFIGGGRGQPSDSAHAAGAGAVETENGRQERRRGGVGGFGVGGAVSGWRYMRPE